VGKDPQAAKRLLEALSSEEVFEILHDFKTWARPNQVPPPDPWTIWLILAGRGFGKTWLGSSWVNEEIYQRRRWRWALVAEDAADARDVMVEGEAGILATAPPWNRPKYEPSKRRLTWPNGAVATLFADSDPEALRGPQHDGAWVDELAKFKYAKVTWSNLMFGLRLGYNPKAIVTTTPKPVPIIRELVKNPLSTVTRGTSYDNRANLAPSFFDEIIREYEGTTLGRQELMGELIDPEEAGIIKRSWFRLYSKKLPMPRPEYIVVSLDTAFSDKTSADFTSCQVWGIVEYKGNKRALLLDRWSEQLGFPDLKDKVRKIFLKTLYGPEGKERRPDIILIEDKGSGISLRQDLERSKLPCHPYNPGRADKTMRLHAAAPLVKHGLVMLPESSKKDLEPRDWTLPMIEQVCAFSGPETLEHDDEVDAFSQAMIYFKDTGLLRIKLEGEEDIEHLDETPKRRNPYAQ
jgi:predicted phage terminase large subunit-like protein